tara:strand:- start:168603 stop:169268 length:666 start_codon:yes stop_codon:yes gene_type:complete
MSNVRVVDIINRVSTIVVDTTKTRWPNDELLNWFNDAVMAVVNRRPDANIANAPFITEPAKSKQVIPSDGLRLIDVVYNTITGTPIRKAPRNQLDDQVVNWHKSIGNTVLNYVFDERDPKTFYIYPQPASAASIEIIYSVAPAPVAISNFDSDNTTLPIDDSYLNPIVDFMLHRAYSKDADYAANAARATQHYQVFLSELGEKFQVDGSYNPKNNRAKTNG